MVTNSYLYAVHARRGSRSHTAERGGRDTEGMGASEAILGLSAPMRSPGVCAGGQRPIRETAGCSGSSAALCSPYHSNPVPHHLNHITHTAAGEARGHQSPHLTTRWRLAYFCRDCAGAASPAPWPNRHLFASGSPEARKPRTSPGWKALAEASATRAS